MWVFIILLLAGFTIITVRMFRNGALEEPAALAESEAVITPVAQVPAARAAGRRSPGAIAAAATQGEEQAAPAAPYPPPVAEHQGGPCPSCGSETVPGAKFCGECGTRLVS